MPFLFLETEVSKREEIDKGLDAFSKEASEDALRKHEKLSFTTQRVLGADAYRRTGGSKEAKKFLATAHRKSDVYVAQVLCQEGNEQAGVLVIVAVSNGAARVIGLVLDPDYKAPQEKTPAVEKASPEKTPAPAKPEKALAENDVPITLPPKEKPLEPKMQLEIPTGVAEKMLDFAGVKKGDVVYNLYSDEGVIPVVAAAKYGVKAFGFELSKDGVELANAHAKENNVAHLVTIEKKDVSKVDLAKASVVTLYMSPAEGAKLIPQFDKLPKGARIVSYDFWIEGLTPERIVKLGANAERGIEGGHLLYLFTVPLRKETYKRVPRPDPFPEKRFKKPQDDSP